jgi:hypothetical protein
MEHLEECCDSDYIFSLFTFIVFNDWIREHYTQICNKRMDKPKDQFCYRVNKYFSSYKQYGWGHYYRFYKYIPAISFSHHPEQDDPYVRAMYLEEQEEKRIQKRLIFLLGTHRNTSTLSKLVEPIHTKYILRMAGL